MKRKVVLITEIIAPYRIPVLHHLAHECDVDLRVIFLAENDPALRKWQVYKNELRFPYQVLPSTRHRAGRYNLLLNWGMSKALLQAQPDVIVCGGYNYPAAWQAALWSRRKRIPFLLWIESTAKDARGSTRWAESLKARFLSYCTAFVAAGESSRDYLLALGMRNDVVFTAPNAVDIEFFASRSNAVRQECEKIRSSLHLPSRYILSVGRLVREKGVFDLLQAYIRLPATMRSEIGLVFAGSGKAEPELRKLADQVEPGQIQFRGFCQREQLPQLYALADIFVLATHSDPWGLVVNEAMSCGLPIVCSEVAGCAPDLVRDGWNGRVVPPRDPDALAAALIQLGGDPTLVKRMGERSGQRISRYSPQACADGIAKAALSSLEFRTA